MPTNKTPSMNAIALYHFLEKEWDAMGIAPTTWCRNNGIPDPTVLRWKGGVEPDVRNLKRVADALGRSFLDILIAAKYISPKEANGHVVAPREVDARSAIRQDPKVSPIAKEALLQLLDSIELVESGATNKVKVSSGRRRR